MFEYLACSGGIAVPEAGFGKGEGIIWLDEVECFGTESNIADCKHNGWGIHDCIPAEDAGVICSGNEMMLLFSVLAMNERMNKWMNEQILMINNN